jgi:pyruvate,orthophosphate dikinase
MFLLTNILEYQKIMNSNLIFEFSPDKTDGDSSLVDLLGGKGANLAEMSKMGIQVPPGFTITTEACNSFIKNKQLPEGLVEDVNPFRN